MEEKEGVEEDEVADDVETTFVAVEIGWDLIGFAMG